MEYSFRKINIEAPFPTRQCGHSCQTEKLNEVRDHLFARVFSFRDKDRWIIHYSMDLLAFDLKNRDRLEDYLKQYYGRDDLKVITSTTHTHYANDVRDPEYVSYLFDLLCRETVLMEYVEKEDISTSYQYVHTNAVGRSRISGYETGNEYLCLIRFFSKDEDFLNIVFHNCHPTILEANVPYFSAEYPGHVLRRLEQDYPQIDFTFFQGAAGDISSRFVRSGQDYKSMTQLGDALYEEVKRLLSTETERFPLKLDYKEVPIEYEHEFAPLDLSKIRQDLSERELETIRLGQIERAKLEEKRSLIFSDLIEKALITCLDLGSVRIIFFPNEIFSEYMNCIDVSKEMLVSYSNGYGPYVLPIDFPYITYEMFTDTLTRQTKERIIGILKTI